MKVSNLLVDTLDELRKGTRRIFHQGGQYSGKTVSILGALATLCTEELGGKTTVTGKSFPHLKGGALSDFLEYIFPHFKVFIRSYNKTNSTFTFYSGAILEFKVFEDKQAAHGQKRKRLFVNELNAIPLPVFEQLDSRSEQTISDYNPSIQFYAHTEYLTKPEDGNVFIYSDHRNNPFLTEAKHAEIEGFWRPSKDGLGGERFKVYSRGITGNVEGLIFPTWECIADEDFIAGTKDGDKWNWSIDFGFTNDPTAIVRSMRVGKILYVQELAYEAGLDPRTIKRILKSYGFKPSSDMLYCDHDVDSIKSLHNVGIVYALRAQKGQGSINAGILMINNNFLVKFPQSSLNIAREQKMYSWDIDKKTGKSINEPVEDNNHLMDAIRYGVYSKYLKKIL